MSSIISVNRDAASQQGVTSNQTAAGSEVKNSQSAAAEVSTHDGSGRLNDSIELSARAKKIQKLNEEFFPAGPKSVKITSAFIQRLQEYGFLSAEEADKFNPTKKSAIEQPASTVGELSLFIDDLSARLKKDAPESGLINLLQKAKSVINNLDGSNPTGADIDVGAVVAELKRYTYSEGKYSENASSGKAEALDYNDKASLRQLSIALQVADKLNPSSNASQKINAYLRHL